MAKLDRIIEMLENNNFEIAKNLKNPTITISNTVPIKIFPKSNVSATYNFELRARHNSREFNEKALKIIHKIFGDYQKCIEPNVDYLDSYIGVVRIEYEAP